MAKDKNLWFISAGLGWPRTNEIKKKFTDRYIQTEASEQTALDIAVGLAYAGKTPMIYTITPFLYRGFETIRTYIDHENLNVKMVGAGRDDDYSKHDGFSHDAKDISKILGCLENIKQYFPKDNNDLEVVMDLLITKEEPAFLSITR